ncbi:MAG: phosphatidylserine/phosphatidylglycerophosphate/cardiolipin synthase family protein [Elusimicrobiales bacterium]|nr:phosphatidylserine/phosphatidylglycerophosphate/cardiolipin synthase family protein [Elusimicrobiales bacterium]MDQ7774036.1 phosphatidylserine/phosphatidylglycerophosphate/cardiolipin synthase family protein [Elusimicrobiales bacterium]
MNKKTILLLLALAHGASNTATAGTHGDSGALDQLLRSAPAAQSAPDLPEASAAEQPKAAAYRFMGASEASYLEGPYLLPESLEMDEAAYSANKSVTSLYRGSAVGNASFKKELESLTGARFTGGNSAKLLFGPDSFAMRDKLMLEAKKSIYITAYSFHDDETGNRLADLLIAKRRQGLDVKLIADGKVALANSRKLLNRMEAGGVEVLRWREPGRLLDIWHVKMLVVDGRYSFVGGINVGDVYSHRGSGPKWQDYDVLYSGPAVTDTLSFFAREWNASLGGKRTPVVPAAARHGAFETGSAELSVVFQNPPHEKQILGTILKSIYGARERINIAHSYFIAIPPLRDAIIDALGRGVEVNIITNTSKSIDAEAKHAAVPIIRSLAGIYPYGANIYLNRGENLHGKFMTVDGVFATIGSYNMHPRSEKYDSEMNVNLSGAEAVRQFDATFAGLIANAQKVEAPSDLAIPGGFVTFLSNIIERYFFDMLSPA